MSTIEQLIKEYSAGAQQWQRYRKSLDTADPLQADIDKSMADIISDMRYAIDWMRHGRRPGNRRGAERTDIYRQRELMTELKPVELDESERHRLAILLLMLTKRERQCYLLFYAHGLTYSEIGSILKVSKASVQTFCKRAKAKVQQGLKV